MHPPSPASPLQAGEQVPHAGVRKVAAQQQDHGAARRLHNVQESRTLELLEGLLVLLAPGARSLPRPTG